MRFVYINELTAGMTLARNLYGKRSELLLTRGSVLTDEIIKKLKQQGLDGVYVTSNESSDNSNLKGIISTRLKENTVRAVRNFFIGIDQGHKEVISVSLSAIRGLIDDIIDEISLDKNAVVNMIDIKNFDDYTYDHCVSVGALSIMVGVSAGMNRRGLYRLGMGALLHDIGKIFVPKEIVNKKGILTYDEYEIMKKHSEYGCEYLKRQDAVPLESSIAVLTHHERYDGKGYPLGLSANKQPIEGKIISICDNFDALTSDRPYRSAFSPSEAIEHIMGNSGIMFDPKILNLFIKKIVPYPVGTNVELSNGRKGIVIENFSNSFMRPKIKVFPLPDEVGSEEIIYDLCNDPSLLNVTVLGISRKQAHKV